MATRNSLWYPSNYTVGSDIRLVWSGAILPNRKFKTVIWDAYFIQHTGYYAWAWDSEGTGVWNWGDYEIGSHPFPCEGTIGSEGFTTGGTSDTGIVHYYEIAGGGSASDRLASSGAGPSYLVTKGIWVKQAITDELITVSTANDTIRRTYYVDLSDTTKNIVHTQSSTLASTPANPIFALGASEWTVYQTDGNAECPSGYFRNIKIFNNAALSASNIVSESNSESNSAVTAAGISSLFYSNINPTPSDIIDKSGAGHTPSWANANRPSLYSFEVADVAVAIPRPVSTPQTKLRFTGKLKF